jgi:hypothetical protein
MSNNDDVVPYTPIKLFLGEYGRIIEARNVSPEEQEEDRRREEMENKKLITRLHKAIKFIRKKIRDCF